MRTVQKVKDIGHILQGPLGDNPLENKNGALRRQFYQIKVGPHDRLNQLIKPLLFIIFEFCFPDIETLRLVCRNLYNMIGHYPFWKDNELIIRHLQRKLKVSLFNLGQTELKITDQLLFLEETKQLIPLLPKLGNPKNFTAPEKTPYQNFFTQRGRIFDLTSTNIAFSLPLLIKDFPVRYLNCYIGDSENEISPKVLMTHFDKFLKVLQKAPRDSLNFLSSYDLAYPINRTQLYKLDQQKHSNYFKPLLERLVNEGHIINRPLRIYITGIISIKAMNLLVQFLQNNPTIYRLDIIGKFFADEKEDPNKLFAGLSKTNLVELSIDAKLSEEDCQFLGENLPSSLEQLSLEKCKLRNPHLKALSVNLAKKNIKTLTISPPGSSLPYSDSRVSHFHYNYFSDFSPLADALSQMPNCTQLNFGFDASIIPIDTDAKAISQIMRLCSQPTTRIYLQITNCYSKFMPAVSDIIKYSPSLENLMITYHHSPEDFITEGLSFKPRELIPSPQQQLRKDTSNNFNLIGLDISHPHGTELSQRNQHIKEINKILLDITLSPGKWDLLPARTYEILNRILPEKIQAVRQISQKLAEAYPEAHQKCQEKCDELQAQVNELRYKYAARTIQSAFRFFLAQTKYQQALAERQSPTATKYQGALAEGQSPTAK